MGQESIQQHCRRCTPWRNTRRSLLSKYMATQHTHIHNDFDGLTWSMALPVPILAKLTCTLPHFYQLSNTELHSNRKINVESTNRNSLVPVRKVPLVLPRHHRCSRSSDFYENPFHSILIRSNEMLQYAGIYLLQNYSTCFGCPSHPSSGVHKIITAASGTGHITYLGNNLPPAWPRPR